MRIQSRFKDYYDSLQSTDREDVLYVRATTEHSREDFTRDYKETWEAMRIPGVQFIGLDPRGRTSWDSETAIGNVIQVIFVYFCGKCYPALRLSGTKATDLAGDVRTEAVEVFYTKESFLAFVQNKGASFWTKKSHEMVKNWVESYSNQRLFEPFFKEITIDDEAFRKMGAPVWVVTPYQVFVDPRLTDFCFARHIHLIRAYQELDMYLGNALAPRREIGWVGDDKVRAEQHGFDKHSFRNVAPGGKARKQKDKPKGIAPRKM